MKILHSVASLNPNSGGPARSVPQLALGLARSGNEVGIWAPDGGQAPLADLHPEESKSLQIFSGAFQEALAAFGRPDLVHDHGIWLGCHREVARVCREQGIPRMVSPRGMLEPWALNHKKWKKRMAWWLYQEKDLEAASGLHATAPSEAEQLRKLGLTPPIVIAANGVNECPISVEGGGQADEAEKERPKRALFLSRVHPKKGLLMLLEAWAAVQPKGWQMRVVGPDEGGHRDALESRVKELNLAEEWRFEDSLEGDKKWQAMVEADLFILPSHSENFGIVVAEALAAGTPVITTTGTPWEGLLTHRCGWWVAPRVEELTMALATATDTSRQERSEMGERGKEWVAREFGWQGIADEIVRFYQEVLDRAKE